MTTFKLSPGLLLGQSSDIDAVFLPVNIDGEHQHGEEFEPHADWNANSPAAGLHHQLLRGQRDEDKRGTSDVCVGISKEQKAFDDEDDEDGEAGPSRVLMHAIITDTPDSNDWCYRATLTSIAVIVVIVSLLVFGHRYIRNVLTWLEHVDPKVSVSVITGLFVLISFPMAWGLSLLMVTSGYLYGCLYGPLVVTFSVTIGLTISLPVMRCLCAAQLRARFYSRKVEAIINVVSGSHGMKVIALTRLTPIPFGLQNALFSLSSMSLMRYLISSVGGLVPMTLLNCYMGSTLRTMEDLMTDDSNRMTGFFIFGGQILITVVLLWFVVRKARVELKKAMDESDKSSTALPNGDCSKTVYVDHDGL
ncbi:transmembrane protein 64 [Aplysia californica]|uniref:Transmembrane protein 64 n=1 Tax=Aplysia californica TaxID=6500 RepID=A0ABM0JSZ7_APLCA|nr:transmembrane protein 64 [Aplysia californica]XP_005100796.1 transmembrane protein 64 [Aplysia californica]